MKSFTGFQNNNIFSKRSNVLSKIKVNNIIFKISSVILKMENIKEANLISFPCWDRICNI